MTWHVLSVKIFKIVEVRIVKHFNNHLVLEESITANPIHNLRAHTHAHKHTEAHWEERENESERGSKMINSTILHSSRNVSNQSHDRDRPRYANPKMKTTQQDIHT